jgi:ATP-dependent DNA helicase RecG
MILENRNTEMKSLRFLTGRNVAWKELAKDCVCFANAQGGRILIGIEDGEYAPPPHQIVDRSQLERIQKRVGELTVNVRLAVRILQFGETGGEFLEIAVSRAESAASTSDGRYYLRVGDTCKPLVGDDIHRLMNERAAQPWETLTTLHVPHFQTDARLLRAFTEKIRESERVKPSVREKTNDELLSHYYLTIDGLLTNLGILCVGRREDRARLGAAPVIQFIKYDENGQKTRKIAWDDYSCSPMELVESVWNDIADFRELYEIPDGLWRSPVSAFDQRVVRELLVNALVHRPYTQRGDIFLNLYPDRLEIVNPGLLPLGVTPRNILHQSVRRNNELARVFHDLGLMEREGSGFDLMYEILASQGRAIPEVREAADRVEVIIGRRIIKPEIIGLMERMNTSFPLRQREKITLGILAQHEAMTASELAQALELTESKSVNNWLGRLPEWKVVLTTGRTKGARYHVNPEALRKLNYYPHTTLTRIEPHRLSALVLEDVQRYPGSSIGDIHERIGSEINRRLLRQVIEQLCQSGDIMKRGEKRWRAYWPGKESIDKP